MIFEMSPNLLRAGVVRFRRSHVVAPALLLFLGAACAPPSTIGGVRSTPHAPSGVWKAPAEAGAPLAGAEMTRATRGSAVPTDVLPRLDRLTLDDVVNLALSNSPQTRITWAQARAQSAVYGSVRGRFLPTLTGDINGGPAQSVSQNPAVIGATRSTTTASLQLQYLLFDFGARGGNMAAAHEALFAADLTHNATVQGVVLQAQNAYFTYQASHGLSDAALTAVQTAQANLAAAERRHDVGLATIADVLQARTALAQSQLAAQTAGGNVQAARAQLALALGLAANAKFDVAPDTGVQPVRQLAENVDSLIERAVRDRPDVKAARALARQSEQQLRSTRSALLPTINLGANSGRVFSNQSRLEGHTYALTLDLSVPLFAGGSHVYDVTAAQENAAAAAARSEQTRLLAVSQVFTSYYALQTATQRVATSAELLASATQSEDVARGRYAEGVGSILDLLTAQTALSDARAQAVQSRWTWYAALAQLSRDAGVLGTRGEPNLTLTPAATGRKE
jgi:outer membrane protein